MDMTDVKVGTLCLSEAILVAGYETPDDYHGCVLACAYRLRFGGSLYRDAKLGKDYSPIGCEVTLAADAFNVPREVAKHAERMCFERRSPAEISASVASKGY